MPRKASLARPAALALVLSLALASPLATAWAGAGSPVLSGLLVAFTLLDVPFTIGYLGLTWWLLRRLGLGPWAWRLPLLVAAVELVEDVLFLVAAVRLPAANEAWARVLSISSSVKWAVLALVVVALLPSRPVAP